MKTKSNSNSFLNKDVLVNRRNYSLKFHIEITETINGQTMYTGPITESSESCPFKKDESYSVSENEIKYFIVL